MQNAYTISNVIKDLNATVLTDIYQDKVIESGSCCDMLSWAMAKVTSRDCWFTILSSMNVIAVASLSDCPVVVLTEGVTMDETVLAKARSEEICIVMTRHTTFEAAGILFAALHEKMASNATQV